MYPLPAILASVQAQGEQAKALMCWEREFRVTHNMAVSAFPTAHSNKPAIQYAPEQLLAYPAKRNRKL